MKETKVTKQAARRLNIENQLINPRKDRARKKDILEIAEALGCIQIDTISVVERAHHVTLWTRLGQYDKQDLHDLAYKDQRLFEYWAHAACFVPMNEYRYHTASMEARKEKMVENFARRSKAPTELLDEVLDRVKKEGPLAAKDFEHKRERKSKGWWDWKPAKVALETLFGAGTLMVSHRENFQRHYDLTENVLPPSIDATPPGGEERAKFFALKTVGALGVVKAPDLRKYYHPWNIALRLASREWEKILGRLADEGAIARIEMENEGKPHYCLEEDADRLRSLETDPGFEWCRLFTNFDNLLWDRERVKALFGFEPKLETYVPAPQRKYGYYNLPILYGDRLVGRVVPKMDRKRGVLIVRSTWHEPWFEPDEDFEDSYAEALESFALFNGADEIEAEEESPRIG